MATPLTIGRLFNQRDLPAFPTVVKKENSLDTTPIVAKQFVETILCSPELNLSLPDFAVFSISCE